MNGFNQFDALTPVLKYAMAWVDSITNHELPSGAAGPPGAAAIHNENDTKPKTVFQSYVLLSQTA